MRTAAAQRRPWGRSLEGREACHVAAGHIAGGDGATHRQTLDVHGIVAAAEERARRVADGEQPFDGVHVHVEALEVAVHDEAVYQAVDVVRAARHGIAGGLDGHQVLAALAEVVVGTLRH